MTGGLKDSDARIRRHLLSERSATAHHHAIPRRLQLVADFQLARRLHAAVFLEFGNVPPELPAAAFDRSIVPQRPVHFVPLAQCHPAAPGVELYFLDSTPACTRPFSGSCLPRPPWYASCVHRQLQLPADRQSEVRLAPVAADQFRGSVFCLL